SAELGEPVVVSSKNLRQQRTVWHAVQQQTDRGIDNTYIHPIGIHVLEVLLRNVAPAPDFIKGRGTDHLFRRLKPHTCLCPRAQPDHPVAIAVPPIAIILADKLWNPVLERRPGSARPQVRWLKHVIVRGYHPVIHHDLTLLLGVALSRCCRLNDLTGQTIPPARRAPYREVRWRPLRA